MDKKFKSQESVKGVLKNISREQWSTVLTAFEKS